jgi:hypothetical protein
MSRRSIIEEIQMAMKIPRWTWYVVVAVAAVAVFFMAGAAKQADCPGSQVWCPGVGCVSGSDKCFAGSKGGPSAVFSKEGFEVMKPKPWNADWAKILDPSFHSWPGVGKKSVPPDYGKEKFVNRKCPDGSRTDGPCLMDFPGF